MAEINSHPEPAPAAATPTESAKLSLAEHEEHKQEPDDDKQEQPVESLDVAAPTVDELDPAVEKRLRAKFDRTLVPLVFVAYLLAFLDRSNIGNAEAAGMRADLGFDDAHYQVRCCRVLGRGAYRNRGC